VNSLKSMLVAVVLSALAYGVYATLTTTPPPETPKEVGAGWEQGPQVELPPVAAAAPSHAPSAPSASAPRYVPPAAATETPPGLTPTPLAAAPTISGAPLANAAPQADAAPPPVETPPPVASPTDVAPLGASPLDAPPPVKSEGSSASAMNPAPTASAAPSDGGDEFQREFDRAMQNAQAMLERGELDQALLSLSQWYDDDRLDTHQQVLLLDILNQLAGTVVYSSQHLLLPPYQVQPGESLEQIAERHQVPWQLLAKINGLADPHNLAPGAMLKVIRGPFDAVVDLRNYRLTLSLGNRYAGRFPIGLGRDQEAPGEGAPMMVQNKIWNPTYQGPDRSIAADDPANPLGEHWIDLGNQLGIHGTSDPGSLGRHDGPGFVRLGPNDVQDVFDILSVGSRVVIRR
jgi:lipoprotein-anchoring transpeptidase ErfK/SrfK